jgi:hypothetical protein
VIDTPSIFKLIRKTEALGRVLPTFTWRWTANTVRRKLKSPQVDCAR